jgi:hypothetical protein
VLRTITHHQVIIGDMMAQKPLVKPSYRVVVKARDATRALGFI